jgi:hypothetical protein
VTSFMQSSKSISRISHPAPKPRILPTIRFSLRKGIQFYYRKAGS